MPSLSRQLQSCRKLAPQKSVGTTLRHQVAYQRRHHLQTPQQQKDRPQKPIHHLIRPLING